MLPVDPALEVAHEARPERGVLERRAREQLLGRRHRVAGPVRQEVDFLDVLQAVGVARGVDVARDEGKLDDGLVRLDEDPVADDDGALEGEVEDEQRERDPSGACGSALRHCGRRRRRAARRASTRTAAVKPRMTKVVTQM